MPLRIYSLTVCPGVLGVSLWCGVGLDWSVCVCLCPGGMGGREAVFRDVRPWDRRLLRRQDQVAVVDFRWWPGTDRTGHHISGPVSLCVMFKLSHCIEAPPGECQQHQQQRFVFASWQLCGLQWKIPPCGFLTFFPKRMGIFNQIFTHLFYVRFYTILQIFIQLSPTLTKLCHTKRDHPTNFYISLEF